MSIIKLTTLMGETEPYKYTFVTDNGSEFDFPEESLRDIIQQEKPTRFDHAFSSALFVGICTIESLADEAISAFINENFKYPVLLMAHPDTCKQLWEDVGSNLHLSRLEDQRLIKYKGIAVIENDKVKWGEFVIE